MASKGPGNGKVVQVIGTVVDVEFAADDLPEIYNALELDLDGERLVLEVEQHVGNNWVRCLALGTTDGLRRGIEVADTGAPVRRAAACSDGVIEVSSSMVGASHRRCTSRKWDSITGTILG